MASDPTRDDIEARRAARKQRRRSRTRDEIIETAERIVLRDGASRFTLASIATELGLTKPALYYYFSSKEALIFEFYVREWVSAAGAVHAAVARTETGADAIEALIRTYFDVYVDRLDAFALVHQPNPAEALAELVQPEQIARIRPINGLLYGGVEARIAADQAAGRAPADLHPRRLAFLAHTSTMGLLAMRAITASANDPLLHTDADLVADLVASFRGRVGG